MLLLCEAREEAQVHGALLRAREELQPLASCLQEVREEERLDITRALEGTVGQLLASLHIDAAWLRRRAESLGPQGQDLAVRAESMTRTILAATEGIRRLGGSLRPGHLDDLGLPEAAEWLVREFERRTGVRSLLLPPDEEVVVHPTVATALYRILEEAQRRHAEAAACRRQEGP